MSVAVEVSSDDIEEATKVLRQIAEENTIGVLFDKSLPHSMREGEEPTPFASLMKHKGLFIAATRSPAATPNVIEPLMHEMAHAVLGCPEPGDDSPEAYALDRKVCHLVIKWAARLPESLGPRVIEDSQSYIDEYDSQGL